MSYTDRPKQYKLKTATGDLVSVSSLTREQAMEALCDCIDALDALCMNMDSFRARTASSWPGTPTQFESPA